MIHPCDVMKNKIKNFNKNSFLCQIRKYAKITEPCIRSCFTMPQLITRITSQEKLKSNFAKCNKRGFNDVLRNLIPTFCTMQMSQSLFSEILNHRTDMLISSSLCSQLEALNHPLLILYIYSFSVYISTKSWGNL